MSDELSMSGHRQIKFRFQLTYFESITFLSPFSNDWISIIASKQGACLDVVVVAVHVQLKALLINIIGIAYEETTPQKTRRRKIDVL